MADTTLFGLPFGDTGMAGLQQLAEQGNPIAAAALEQIANEQMNRAMAEAAKQNQAQAAQAAPALAPAASSQTPPPALTDAASTQSNPIYIPITEASGFSANPMARPASTNRRDMSVMSMKPPAPIGLNEMLIRMGAAGLGASAEGGMQSLAAIGNTYGAIQDANRASGLDAYKAQMDALAKGNKKKGVGSAAGNEYTKAVMGSIDIIEGYLDQQGDNKLFNDPLNDVTGMFGYLQSNIPGTPAHNVQSQIATIEAAIGFDRLQAMRDSSPTGGALGAINQAELDLLKSSLGSLKQSQTAPEFRRNLQRIKDHYLDIIHGPGNRPAGTQSSTSSGGYQLTEDDNALINRVLSQ